MPITKTSVSVHIRYVRMVQYMTTERIDQVVQNVLWTSRTMEPAQPHMLHERQVARTKRYDLYEQRFEPYSHGMGVPLFMSGRTLCKRLATVWALPVACLGASLWHGGSKPLCPESTSNKKLLDRRKRCHTLELFGPPIIAGPR